MSAQGIYPAYVTPAWVPTSVPALLPAARRDPLGVEVTGLDGADRPARSVGRVVLVPTMPRRSALVDLDTLPRGCTPPAISTLQVWLGQDDPALVSALRSRCAGTGSPGLDGVGPLAAARQYYRSAPRLGPAARGRGGARPRWSWRARALVVARRPAGGERSRDLAGLRTERRRASTGDAGGSRSASSVPVVAWPPPRAPGAGLVGAALALPDGAAVRRAAGTPVSGRSTTSPAGRGRRRRPRRRWWC